MSTSPSWFDKDKFSRLVKKPGPKGGPVQALPSAAAAPRTAVPYLKAEAPAQAEDKKEGDSLPEQADAPAPPGNAVPETPAQPGPSEDPPLAAVKVFSKQNMMTSQPLSMGAIRAAPPVLLVGGAASEPIRAPVEISTISLKAKAPSLDAPLPTLPRRTAPLPALKPVFQYGVPVASQPPLPPPVVRSSRLPRIESEAGKSGKPASVLPEAKPPDDLTQAWEQITQLNEELRKASRERDQATGENGLLREQLKAADDGQKNPGEGKALAAPSDENFTRLTRERDELNAKVEDIGHAITERDRIRGDYMELREQFEILKQSRHPGHEVAGEDAAALKKELESLRTDSRTADEDLRRQLTEREQAIDGLKASAKTVEDDLRKQIEDRDKQLDERGKELESHKSQTSEGGGEMEDLRRQLTEREQAIEGLKASAKTTEEDLRKQLEDRDKQLDERGKELESHKSQTSEAGGTVEDLRRQLTEREQAIDGLKASAKTTEEDLRKQIEDRDKQLDERGKELESHKSQTSEAGGTVEDLRRQLTEREQAIDGLKASAKTTEEDLRKQLEDRDKQLDERGKELELHKSLASETGGTVEDLRRQLTEKEKVLDGLRGSSAGVEEGFRKQIAEKEVEIEAAKTAASELQDTIGNLKMELADVREQLKKAGESGPAPAALQDQITQLKEEASVSQRGLALSQKALQETRDALREAQEASSQSKASLENIKKENSTLVQQNMLLQAQNDQVARDLSAAKAKRAAKG